MAEKERTFEESMKRLQEIVDILEKNDRPLDETISLFEEGLDLVGFCDRKLKQFETQIDDIVKRNSGDPDED